MRCGLRESATRNEYYFQAGALFVQTAAMVALLVPGVLGLTGGLSIAHGGAIALIVLGSLQGVGILGSIRANSSINTKTFTYIRSLISEYSGMITNPGVVFASR